MPQGDAFGHTGYLIVDNRASGAGTVRGQQPRFDQLTGQMMSSAVFEADTLVCSHCRVAFIKNPDRTRERGKCPKCFDYLCDPCAGAYHVNEICKPWAEVVEELKSGKVLTPVLAKSMKG
jgi:hypothetical protein